MAVESDRIRADAVEIAEFPHLANRYSVRGVPKIVINETVSFEGTVRAEAFLSQVFRALGAAQPAA
jgi:predicted DsbA family dithiol-disulfide isomerase